MNKCVNDSSMNIEVLVERPLPADTDVRSFALMNLEKVELRHLMTRFEHAGKAADLMPAMRLLIAAWDERPSGSLPNDDVILCRAAGVRPSHWQNRKSSVMRGWTLCIEDDRWYSALAVTGVALASASKTKGRKRYEENALARGATFSAVKQPNSSDQQLDDDDGIPF